MTRHIHSTVLSASAKPSVLAAAFVMALAVTSAQALDLSTEETEIYLDTTLSYGIGFRVSDRQEKLVAKSHFDPLIATRSLQEQIAAPGRFSANSDDGNLNFDQWDVISNQARILSELDVRHGNFGLFVRANAFYDFEIEDHDRISGAAKDKVGSRARLLDAYVTGDFDVADRLLSLRLGRQVVSWGESTFIPGGMNVINPVDVTALRTAGAELRDAFLPLNMLWGSYNFTRNFSLEALYMFEWDRVEPEPAGTFFSSNDFATDGGRFAMLGFGLVPDPVRNQGLFDEVCVDGNFGATDKDLPPQLVAQGCAVALPRGQNRNAKNSGQFGLAGRLFLPQLNDTELGFYYLRYHSRLPIVTGISVTSPDVTTGRVFVEYPEDIDLFGASFNTTVYKSLWSLAGEVTWRPDLPLQIDDVELLFAGLSPLNVLIPAPVLRFKSQLGQFGPGEEVSGFVRRSASQAQVTLTRLFGPNTFTRADQVLVLAEIGATHIWDLPEREELRFEGPGTDTGGGPDALTGDLRNPVTTTNGFATAFSWGYRAVVAPTYNSLFGAWNVTPRIAFNHDVTGTTPGPGGNFISGRKQVTLGVGFDYQARWRADFAYTMFFGAGANNLLNDRDFIAASVSYSF